MYKIVIILLFTLTSCNLRTKKAELKAEKVENIELLKNVMIKQIQKIKISIKFHEQSNNLSEISKANLKIADLYNKTLNEYEKSLIYSQKSKDYSISINDTLSIAKINLFQSNILEKKGDIKKARFSISEAIKLYRISNNKTGIANSLLQLSKLEFYYGVPEIAEVSFEKSKEIHLSLNNKFEVNKMNKYGIELYNRLGKTDKVIEIKNQLK